MHQHRLGRPSAIAVTITCLVATVCYAGAITQGALAGGVLTGVLVCTLVTEMQAVKRGVGLALITGLVVGFGWSVVVNALTGDSNGPAARSTVIATACAAFAVSAAATRRPSLFLVPVGGIIFGALALGAGGEVRIVALAVVVVAVVALAVVEHDGRHWLSGGFRWMSVVLIALLVAAAAIVGALVQAHRDARPARVLDAGAVNARIHPRWADPLPNPAPVHHKDARAHSHTSTNPKPATRHQHHSRLWKWLAIVALATLALLLLFLAALAARLLVVRLKWRRIRRQLQNRAPGDAVAGAWVWARLRLTACRLPISPSMSPDLDGASVTLADLPGLVAGPLRRLAPHAAVCAFSAAPIADNEDVERTWHLADEVASAGFAVLTSWGQWRARFRPPVRQSRSGKASGMTVEAGHG